MWYFPRASRSGYRSYLPEFKSKDALAAIKGDKGSVFAVGCKNTMEWRAPIDRFGHNGLAPF